MRLAGIALIILSFSLHSVGAVSNSPDSLKTCRKAFMFKTDDYAVALTIDICSNAAQVPVGYETALNMVVCDDKLCANVLLNISWDLAGNYMRFDTIAGKPLTKFDHKRFSAADYKKLDQIFKDRNSMLRVLEKSDLVDKSIKLKATSVDAVSGATPATIKNAVVEGAVYSSHTLWHFVNGQIKDSIRAFTLRNYSEQMALQMLVSDNFETQLFALKQIPQEQYESRFELLFQVIRKSSPLIRAYILNRAPLPFHDQDKNRKLALLFPDLDGYSKSTFIDRITSEKPVAVVFIPLILHQFQSLDQRQQDKLITQIQKFEISGLEELIKDSAGRNNQ